MEIEGELDLYFDIIAALAENGVSAAPPIL